MTAITSGDTNNEVIAKTRRDGTGFWLHLFFEVQAKRHAPSVTIPVGARYFNRRLTVCCVPADVDILQQGD